MNKEDVNEAVQAAEPSGTPKVEASSPPTVTPGVAGDTPPPRPEEDETMEAATASVVPPPNNVAPSPSSTPIGGTVIQASVTDPKVEYEEELLLKWDDHHKSFFELAEDLCHQEQFIGEIFYYKVLIVKSRKFEEILQLKKKFFIKKLVFF